MYEMMEFLFFKINRLIICVIFGMDSMRVRSVENTVWIRLKCISMKDGMLLPSLLEFGGNKTYMSLRSRIFKKYPILL